jgi:hypothetical protein
MVLVPIVLAALALLFFRWYRGCRTRPALLSAIDRDPNRLRILAAYRAGQRRSGLYRTRAETPHEFARRIARDDWAELTAIVEGAAYRTPPPPPVLAQRAWELVRRLPRRLAHPRKVAKGTLRDKIRQAAGAVKPRLTLGPRLPKIKRPAQDTPRAPDMPPSEETQTGRGCILYAAATAGIIGAVVSMGLVFLLGGPNALFQNLLGPVPAVALVMGAGGGLITWIGVRLARDRWVVWVFLGSVGMTLLTVVASFAAQVAAVAVALLVPSLRWWQTRAEIIPGMIEGVTFLLPLTIPIGFLLGFCFFGVAGWLWGRWLASRSPYR